MTAMSRRRRPPGIVRAGSVFGNLPAIAAKLYAALVDGDVVAWADASGDIHFVSGVEPPAELGEVLGIYRMGASAADIEEDLVELRRSRASDAIIF